MKNFKRFSLTCFACLATAFSVVGLLAAKPAYAAETKITGASVTLNKDIVVNYEADGLSGDSATMKFTYRGNEYVVDAAVSEGKAVFPFDKVTPQYLGEQIKAEVVSGENVLATKEEFSVKGYLETLLAGTAESFEQSNEENTAMRRLAVDLLYYGAAAQSYAEVNLDTLATAGLTEEQKALKTEYAALTETDRTLTGESSEKYYWLGAGLRFDYNVSFYFTIAVKAQIENLKMTVNGEEITEFETEVGDGVTYYTARYYEVGAVDFDKVYEAKVYEGNTQIGKTAKYSVKSYVYAMQNDADMGELAQAAYNYGKAAVAYSSAVHEIILDNIVGVKTVYHEGETFDPSGLVVQKVAVNGTKTFASEYTCDDEPLTPLDTTVTVTCGEHTATLPVTVSAHTFNDGVDNGNGTKTFTCSTCSNDVTKTKTVAPGDRFFYRESAGGWTIAFDRNYSGGSLFSQAGVDYVLVNMYGGESLVGCFKFMSDSSGYWIGLDGENRYGISGSRGNYYLISSAESFCKAIRPFIPNYVVGQELTFKAKTIAKPYGAYCDGDEVSLGFTATTVETLDRIATPGYEDVKIVKDKGAVELDRGSHYLTKNQDVDYVEWAFYKQGDASKTIVGSIKIYRNEDGTTGSVSAMDGTHVINASSLGNMYFFQGDAWKALLEYAFGENYVVGQIYYVKVRAVAKSDSEYADSEFYDVGHIDNRYYTAY